MSSNTPLRLERIDQVIARRACQRSKLYSDIAAGLWPPPVRVGRASAWPAHETEALLGAHIAGAGEQRIKELVRELLEQRRAMMPQPGAQAA